MKKLFGNNIAPSCEYCSLAQFKDDKYICSRNKNIKDYKCRSFAYDPLRRVPKSSPALRQFSPEDFII